MRKGCIALGIPEDAIHPVDKFDWRKFYELQNWFQTKYENYCKENNLVAESFNCIGYRIDSSDVDQLEEDCKTWDGSEGTYNFDSKLASLKKFINAVRSDMENGYTYYYDSW